MIKLVAPLGKDSIRYMAAMWAEAVFVQNVALEDAVDKYQIALAEEQFRTAFEERGQPTEWAEEYAKARGQLTPQVAWAVGLSKYSLVMSAAQLQKCVGLLPNDGLPAFKQPRLLRQMRNFDEHWEDPMGQAATWLRQRIPDIVPGRLTFTKKQIWIEGMETYEIVLWATDVDRIVREHSVRAGTPIPPSDWDTPETVQVKLRHVRQHADEDGGSNPRVRRTV